MNKLAQGFTRHLASSNVAGQLALLDDQRNELNELRERAFALSAKCQETRERLAEENTRKKKIEHEQAHQEKVLAALLNDAPPPERMDVVGQLTEQVHALEDASRKASLEASFKSETIGRLENDVLCAAIHEFTVEKIMDLLGQVQQLAGIYVQGKPQHPDLHIDLRADGMRINVVNLPSLEAMPEVRELINELRQESSTKKFADSRAAEEARA